MSVRVTYHCPFCSKMCSSPLFRPPLTTKAICTNCHRPYFRTLGSIISDWKVSLFVYGFLPVWGWLTVTDPLEYRKGALSQSWGATLFTYFFAAVFASALGGWILGNVVGALIRIFAVRK